MLKFLIPSILLLASVLYPASTQNEESRCKTPSSIPGVCTGIRQCTPLLNMLRNQTISPETADFLRQSQCGFEGINPRVCCPIESLDVSQPNQNNQNQTTSGFCTIVEPNGNSKTIDYETVRYNLSINPLLSTDCGVDLSQRILGGERTEIDEFPWIARLEYTTPNGISTTCGGVLISKRYVLTAAHCLKGKDIPSSWRLENVRLGEYNTNTEIDCVVDGEMAVMCADPHLIVGIEEQISHENYEPKSRDQRFDIALLRLSRDVSFTYFVKPICLPMNCNVSRKLYIAGWGTTENKLQSDVKLKVALPIVGRNECYAIYNNVDLQLGDDQICAGGQKGKDSCAGDSGGPMMQLQRAQNDTPKWTVSGLVSFGMSPCGLSGWPGVYTKVSNFVPWILSKMRP